MMYNKTLKDYSFDLAREKIQLDRETLAKDYRRSLNEGFHSWMRFLDDTGLMFFLTGEGSVPSQVTIDKVISDQFGCMKIDLAIAYALAVKLDSADQGPDTPESSESSEMLWIILRGIGAVDLFPPYCVLDTEKQNYLFKIYQIRRRIRHALREFKFMGRANLFLKSSIEAIFEAILDLDDDTVEISEFITARDAHAAIDYWLEWLEEKGEAGPGYYLRGMLYNQRVIPDPYLYDGYYDDEDKDDYDDYDD